MRRRRRLAVRRSSADPRRGGRLPFFYGWVVALVSALGMFATGPGQTFAVSVFVDPIRDDLGLSRTAISAAYAPAGLAAAVGTVGLGWVIDHLGGRRALLTFGTVLGAVCIAMGRVESFLGLVIGFAALRTLGPGGLALSAYTLTAQWFIRRRGTALGLVMLGVAVSQVVLPPVLQRLIASLGWRTAWLLLAPMVWGAVLLPAALLARDRPENVGLRPDGASAPPQPPAAPAVTVPAEPDWTPGQAIRTPTFWLLLLVGAVPSLVGTGLIFHQVSYLQEQRLAHQVAAVFAAFGVTNAGGMMLTGLLVDRVEPRRVLAGFLLLLATAAATLAMVDRVWGGAVVYALAAGAAVGGLATTGGAIWAAYYGRRHLGALRGIDGAVKMSAAALGPLPLALAREHFGTYGAGLAGFSTLALGAAVAALGCRHPGAPPPRSGHPSDEQPP